MMNIDVSKAGLEARRGSVEQSNRLLVVAVEYSFVIRIKADIFEDSPPPDELSAGCGSSNEFGLCG